MILTSDMPTDTRDAIPFLPSLVLPPIFIERNIQCPDEYSLARAGGLREGERANGNRFPGKESRRLSGFLYIAGKLCYRRGRSRPVPKVAVPPSRGA